MLPTLALGVALSMIQGGAVASVNPVCPELTVLSDRLGALMAPLLEGTAADVVVAYGKIIQNLVTLKDELAPCVEHLHETLGRPNEMLPSGERNLVIAYESAVRSLAGIVQALEETNPRLLESHYIHVRDLYMDLRRRLEKPSTCYEHAYKSEAECAA